MRPKLILLFSILFLSRAFAQVVFCPPGAKWTANFTNGIWSTSIMNASIYYSGDTIIGAENVKILSHSKFFNQCNAGSVITYLKQQGDTVFIKNRHTQDTWQTLYNFACGPGQGWTFTYTLQTLPTQTYSYTVDSTSTIIENGFNLRRLYLSFRTTLSPSSTAHTVVTERYGWGFLFQYQGRISACDGDGFISNLCYSDNSFGSKKFTTLPCDYQNPSVVLELVEQQGLQAYPIPCKDILHVSNVQAGQKILIEDLIGRHLMEIDIDSKLDLDLSSLPSGMYQLCWRNNDGQLLRQKLLKE
jgi:hypothetical protein